MSIVVLGALAGLVVLVMAFGGSKIARNVILYIVVLFAAALLAVWFFLKQ
jgi:hypothetical protein